MYHVNKFGTIKRSIMLLNSLGSLVTIYKSENWNPYPKHLPKKLNSYIMIVILFFLKRCYTKGWLVCQFLILLAGFEMRGSLFQEEFLIIVSTPCI